MPNFGLSSKGFKRKRYDDIIESMNARARNLFGEDINLTERSPLGLFLRVIAWSISLLWQLSEKVYFSAYIDTAEGIQLDYVGKNIGFERRLARRASGNCLFQGADGIVIPQGYVIQTVDGIQFQTIDTVTIVNGVVNVPIRAIIAGTSGNVPSNTITEIVSPLDNAVINSVTNPEQTYGGANTESDTEFRARYAISVARGGASTLDSIRASLLELDGVRAAQVVENNTMDVDNEGRPPKSIECYVLGGDAEEVAKAILATKAAGIEPYGSETVVVHDAAGTSKTIRFSYAYEVVIFIRINITTNPAYPIDGDKKIITSLLQYIGGLDEDGAIYAGLGMGEGVKYNRLVATVDSTPGIEDFSIEVSTDDINFGMQNILISLYEVAETDYTKVVVTHA